ncbi:recombinase family protein [Azospirillum brasilense]|uniref:Resolvase n=1 Tax=Azospirillum brasilense TaxID=192 RepID=A0A235H6E7_AZOBR|nr:recombinase family protein [Azospirillum brasilense]OYD81368.1 resolvase [Azospirillum brasilense]
MMDGKFVAYYRCSTEKQGRSGLGLEAQQAAVRSYLNGGNWKLLAEFTEVESGKRNDRPKLEEAKELCRLTGATLVIAKLDRLSRDAVFLLNLKNAGIEFVAADMPNANRLTVGIMALVAENEREAISQRTKTALAAAKARGTRLGNPQGFGGAVYRGGGKAAQKAADGFASTVIPTIHRLQAEGLSMNAIAKRLEEMGVKTARGGSWTAQAVKNVLARA